MRPAGELIPIGIHSNVSESQNIRVALQTERLSHRQSTFVEFHAWKDVRECGTATGGPHQTVVLLFPWALWSAQLDGGRAHRLDFGLEVNGDTAFVESFFSLLAVESS